MVRVSVIMPVYDCIKYLRSALESIGNQTFQDFEMILVNDACFDGSEKLIEVYAANSGDKIRVIRHRYNLGVAESLNDGIVAARGEYIAVQHGDDISLPTRLEKQVHYLEVHEDRALVGSWVQYIDEKGKPKKDGWWIRQVKNIPDDPSAIREKLLLINCVPHTTAMFRKSMLATTGFYDQEMAPAEDYDLWLRTSEKYDLGLIQEVLCQCRQHTAQASNVDSGTKLISKIAIAVTKAKERRGL